MGSPELSTTPPPSAAPHPLRMVMVPAPTPSGSVVHSPATPTQVGHDARVPPSLAPVSHEASNNVDLEPAPPHAIDNIVLSGTILVTGGCGYIGVRFLLLSSLAALYTARTPSLFSHQHLGCTDLSLSQSHTVLDLLLSGFDVVVVDDLSNATTEPLTHIAHLASLPSAESIPFYPISVLDEAALDSVFASHPAIVAVIHLAALKVVAESVHDPLPYYDTNVSGTITLLRVMARHGVKQIVFSSSAAVYGELEVAGSPLPPDADEYRSFTSSSSSRDSDLDSNGTMDDNDDDEDDDPPRLPRHRMPSLHLPPTATLLVDPLADPPTTSSPTPPPQTHPAATLPAAPPHLRISRPHHSPRIITGVRRIHGGTRGVQERDGTNPVNPYGRSKAFSERILRDVSAADPTWSVTILRYFNPCGAHPSGHLGDNPRGTPSNLMPFLAKVVMGELRGPLHVYGGGYPTRDGTAVRDYVHVADLAAAHVAALRRMMGLVAEHARARAAAAAASPDDPGRRERGAGCAIYNIGTGAGTTVMEMVRAMELVSGRSVPVVMAAPRPGDVACVVANADLARRELGWVPVRSVLDMCRDTWQWVCVSTRESERGRTEEKGESVG